MQQPLGFCQAVGPAFLTLSSTDQGATQDCLELGAGPPKTKDYLLLYDFSFGGLLPCFCTVFAIVHSFYQPTCRRSAAVAITRWLG